jgi:hypothetical protein
MQLGVSGGLPRAGARCATAARGGCPISGRTMMFLISDPSLAHSTPPTDPHERTIPVAAARARPAKCLFRSEQTAVRTEDPSRSGVAAEFSRSARAKKTPDRIPREAGQRDPPRGTWATPGRSGPRDGLSARRRGPPASTRRARRSGGRGANPPRATSRASAPSRSPRAPCLSEPGGERGHRTRVRLNLTAEIADHRNR